MPGSGEDTKELVLEDLDIGAGDQAELIIFNDEVNTFDWVIKSLVEVCSHSFEQAEQLALIAHFKGKATVKTDDWSVVKPMKDSLVERGLSAEVKRLQDS